MSFKKIYKSVKLKLVFIFIVGIFVASAWVLTARHFEQKQFSENFLQCHYFANVDRLVELFFTDNYSPKELQVLQAILKEEVDYGIARLMWARIPPQKAKLLQKKYHLNLLPVYQMEVFYQPNAQFSSLYYLAKISGDLKIVCALGA